MGVDSLLPLTTRRLVPKTNADAGDAGCLVFLLPAP